MIGAAIGYKVGLKRGISISAHNSQGLIDQLKKANQFATELREDDKIIQGSGSGSQELN